MPVEPTWWWKKVTWRASAALAAFSSARSGMNGVDGVGDEAVELGGADLVRDRCHLGVHVGGGFGGEAEGGGRDPAGPPGLDGPVLDAGPVLGEAVLQLEGVGDLDASGDGGAGDDGGELGDAELRDQRCPLAGQGQWAVPASVGPGRGVLDRLRGMVLGPGHRREEQVGLGPHRRVPAVPSRTRAPRMSVVEVLPGAGHGSIQAPGTDSFRVEFPLSTRRILEILAAASRVVSTSSTSGGLRSP